MKFEDLNTKTPDELKKLLLDMKKQQMEMRFQLAAGQLENNAKLRQLRRDIARIHTAVNAPKTATKAKAEPAKKAAAKKTKAA